MTPRDRFLRKVHKSACWAWTAAKRGGYGRFRAGPKMVDAHRAAYEFFVGPVPAGANVLHTCDNPGCVNPAHLFLGTHTDNMVDKARKGRTGVAKLKASDVQEILRRQAAGETHKALANSFGVGRTTVSGIVRREEWRWL